LNNIKPQDLNTIADIRDAFDVRLSAKANILQVLKSFGVYLSNDFHHQADMALLALINDPDITKAFLSLNREYD
jgi:hypothetical protein